MPSPASILQTLVLLVLVAATAPFAGRWLAWVYGAPRSWRIERVIFRLCGITPDTEQTWRQYAISALLFSAFGIGLSYAIMRLQDILPFNPLHLPAVSPDLALNTAISFSTNADWQAYGGETTMSAGTQMMALTVQNFSCAATAMAVLAAVIRAFARASTEKLGNFYGDAFRSVTRVLLPLSAIVALVLIWQGVPQTLDGTVTAAGLDGQTQIIALGPVASQDAIKVVGTNGGGFFNANSAHPFENPNALTNLLQCWAMLIIPAGLVFAFGRMVGDRRQGRAIFLVMLTLLVGALALATWSEQGGNPMFADLGIDSAAGPLSPGGNMEGKEMRLGPGASVLFEMITTATGTGAAAAMLDSFLPLGGLAAMLNLSSKEVVFGGVGSGLYGMLIEVVIAVFIAGLMVGRTPEYLGKKIDAKEIKLAMIIAVIVPATALGLGTLSMILPAASASITAGGPHGLTQTLYAYLSTTVNNGSGFGGFGANTLYQNSALGLALAIGRYLVMVPILALAGSIGRKRRIPPSAGTLPTHRATFLCLLLSSIIIVSSLTFLPVFALGPIAEQLVLAAGIGY